MMNDHMKPTNMKNTEKTVELTHVVLVVPTHSAGSHLTVYPNGTRNVDLVHDWDIKENRYAHTSVWAEFVSKKVAEEVEQMVRDYPQFGGVHFSTWDDWIDFQTMVDSGEEAS